MTDGSELEGIVPFRIVTPHELRTKTGDGRDMVILSGYAEVRGEDLQGNPDGTWNRKDLNFRVGPFWRTVESVPVVSMTSIMNVNVATNAGWAVDECDVEDVFDPIHNRRHVLLHCRVGVRDRDGFMFRVNYYVTQVGQLA
jgi:hypothetical protein